MTWVWAHPLAHWNAVREAEGTFFVCLYHVDDENLCKVSWAGSPDPHFGHTLTSSSKSPKWAAHKTWKARGRLRLEWLGDTKLLKNAWNFTPPWVKKKECLAYHNDLSQKLPGIQLRDQEEWRRRYVSSRSSEGTSNRRRSLADTLP